MHSFAIWEEYIFCNCFLCTTIDKTIQNIFYKIKFSFLCTPHLYGFSNNFLFSFWCAPRLWCQMPFCTLLTFSCTVESSSYPFSGQKFQSFLSKIAILMKFVAIFLSAIFLSFRLGKTLSKREKLKMGKFEEMQNILGLCTRIKHCSPKPMLIRLRAMNQKIHCTRPIAICFQLRCQRKVEDIVFN